MATSGIFNYKGVHTVPSAKEFIDIVLSKTQRKTPTVVHKGYHISRVRQFYMKKVKFTQKTINEKLSHILTQFPKVDDIHPFYGDLMHVLYDRDHYKVALGQVGAVRHIVDNVGRDYVRLLKYGDSLYRCKALKRAALGRMATACKKLANALKYLENVRKHIARLPSIDPNERTLLICGFPNVGKSSFLNKVTRADVEVQPYAFTTKSLYLGHTDYNFHPWQVIDTPGILDHSLNERNVIEMQAITALAHLRACILYFMDLSGQCGYGVEQQLSLFKSIHPLFVGKPVVVVLNKCDVATLADLPKKEQDDVMRAIEEAGAKYITTSTLTDVGVGDLKRLACELLLEHRTEAKEGGSRLAAIQNRLHFATPVPRDHVTRGASVPDSVKAYAQLPPDQRPRRVTESDREWANGGPGQYQANFREEWDLENDDWVNDIMPVFMDGKNVADFVDPEIEDRLIELEAEEEERLARREMKDARDFGVVPKYHIEDATLEAANFIRDKVALLRMQRASKNFALHRSPSQRAAIDKFNSRAGMTASEVAELDAAGVMRGKRMRVESPAESAMSRERSSSQHVSTKTSRANSGSAASRERTPSVPRGVGFRDIRQKLTAAKVAKSKMRERSMNGRIGEGDHVTLNLRPKHLYTGKINSIGKRDRR